MQKSLSSFSNYSFPLLLHFLFFFFFWLLLLLLFYSFEKFSHQRQLMVFHRSLSDSKSPQVSRALLSILADLNNAVVWMVSTRPFISKSSDSFINPFSDCTKSTNYNWYKRHFHIPQFLNSLARSMYYYQYFIPES